VLRNVLRWGTKEVVDIERYYTDRETLKTIFTEPLVLIDPVDPTRNVAAAVSIDRLADLKSAARGFFSDPSAKFFKKRKIDPLSEAEMTGKLDCRGTGTLFIQLPCDKISPDIIWGELKKSLNALKKLLENYDFQVMNSDSWSDEEATSVMVLELVSTILTRIRVHDGPPSGDPNQERFLEKHVHNENTIGGPWIKNGRWHVELIREHSSAKELIESKLSEGNLSDIGISKDISIWLMKGGKVMLNKEILALYSSNRSFAEFLTGFYIKQPSWLL
jgi:tRNA nucleotidyltransferase (CCA-adding enzyme)